MRGKLTENQARVVEALRMSHRMELAATVAARAKLRQEDARRALVDLIPSGIVHRRHLRMHGGLTSWGLR